MLVILSLLWALNGCMGIRDLKTQPDRVLFDRAADAMQRGKYDVARLSLQTLINTYPDSDYINRAKKMMEDPRMSSCDSPCNFPRDIMTFMSGSASR